MYSLPKLGLMLLALTVSAPSSGAIASEGLDGVSFSNDPHMLFVPVEEIALALGWEMHFHQESGQLPLNDHFLDAGHLRQLTNGTLLVPLDELQRAGATITGSDGGMQVLVASAHRPSALCSAHTP